MCVNLDKIQIIKLILSLWKSEMFACQLLNQKLFAVCEDTCMVLTSVDSVTVISKPVEEEELYSSQEEASKTILHCQHAMPLRDLGLKKFWSAVRGPNGREPSPQSCEEGRASPGDTERRPAVCSLPLLQVWPSQDSPRGEADGQSFVFPPPDDLGAACDLLGQQHDSGIDSVQVSPSPGGSGCCPGSSQAPPTSSPSPTPGASRRPSCALLHPDHARLLRPPASPDSLSMEDIAEFQAINVGLAASCSSSTTSSMTSVAAAVASMGARSSDPGVDRRRSSTMTARYSLLDALDLEYALLRAAARGSVGPYSLSESLHKLTFTQSLAFPALARGLAGKQRRSAHSGNSRPLDPQDTGFNAFAKVVTALVLVLVSVLVFAVVYKFVRT